MTKQIAAATHWQATFQAGHVLRGSVDQADLVQLAGRDPRTTWRHDSDGGKYRQSKPEDLAVAWQRLLRNHLEPRWPHQAFTLTWLTAADYLAAEQQQPASLDFHRDQAALNLARKPRRKAQ